MRAPASQAGKKIIHTLSSPGFIVVWKRQEIVINVNALLRNTSQSTWEYQTLSGSESTQRKVSRFLICSFIFGCHAWKA